MNPLPPPDPRSMIPYGADGMFPTAPPPIINAPPTGGALLRALRRRWLIASLCSIMAAAAVGAAVWFLLPPSKATVRAQFHMNPAPRGTLGNLTADAQNLEAFRQAQAIKLRSQLVLNSALRNPRIANLGILKEVEDPTAWLERELRTSGSSEILMISYQPDDAEEGRVLLDAITKAYLTEFINNETTVRNNRFNMLRKFKDQYESDVRRRQEQLQEWNKSFGNNKEVLAHRTTMMQREIGYKRDQLIKAEQDISELEARSKVFHDRDPSKLPLDDQVFVEFYQKDVTYANLVYEKELAETRLIDAKTKSVDKTQGAVPRIEEQIKDLTARIKDRQKELRPEAENFWRERANVEHAAQLSNLNTALEFKRTLAAQLRKDVENAELGLRDLIKGQLNVEFSQQNNAAHDEVYKKICSEYATMELDATLPPRVKLIEEARIIPVDAKGRQIKMSAIGGAAAFVLVLAAIAMWEFRNRRVESVDQIVYGLGIPLVGTVPAMPPRRLMGLANGDEDMEQWRTTLQEAVATSRTMLVNAARSADLRLVMVTSAVAGEGKTSLSTQLAVSLAMAGYRTILLDFDLRSPAAFKLIGSPNTPGWAEVLRGEINVTEAIQKTRLDSLDFIAAGECDSLAIKALGHEDLGQLLRWLRAQYEFVIVDTCPVLPVADALVLGRFMDGVIFSILNDVSQIPKIYTATQRIASLGIRTLGAVVNGVRDEKYGYGYGAYGTMKPNVPGRPQPPALPGPVN